MNGVFWQADGPEVMQALWRQGNSWDGAVSFRPFLPWLFSVEQSHCVLYCVKVITEWPLVFCSDMRKTSIVSSEVFESPLLGMHQRHVIGLISVSTRDVDDDSILGLCQNLFGPSLEKADISGALSCLAQRIPIFGLGLALYCALAAHIISSSVLIRKTTSKNRETTANITRLMTLQHRQTDQNAHQSRDCSCSTAMPTCIALRSIDKTPKTNSKGPAYLLKDSP